MQNDEWGMELNNNSAEQMQNAPEVKEIDAKLSLSIHSSFCEAHHVQLNTR